MNILFFLLFILFYEAHSDPIHFPEEKHLRNVRQLTFGGSNLRAQFSPNGRYIVYLGGGLPYGSPCLQVYRIDLCRPEDPPQRLGVGFGNYLSASFYADNQRVLLSGNFHNYLPLGNKTIQETCQPFESIKNRRNRSTESKSFAFDLFEVNNYGNIRRRVTSNNRCTGGIVSPNGEWIVYLNVPDQYTNNLHLMKTDGSEQIQLTDWHGRKGAINFSPDSSRVIFNAEKVEFALNSSSKNLFKQTASIYTIDLKTKKIKELSQLSDRANDPCFHSNNRQIFFTIDKALLKSDIYIADDDGQKQEQITFFKDGLDLLPAFSLNGSKMIWTSMRNSTNIGFNLFIADYVDNVNDEPIEDTLKCPSEVDGELPNSSKDHLKRLREFDQIHFDGEKHLTNPRQLTFGGQNAEGYFSFDNNFIVLQAAGDERYGTKCDQIYALQINQPVDEQTSLRRLSSGLGTCTCAYWFPDGKTSIHASTFASVTKEDLANTCPPKKCQSEQAKSDPLLKKLCNTSYTWDLHPQYDIFKVNEYGNVIQQLTNTHGYDAEGAVSPGGQQIVFTSVRSGDPELWLMNADGSNLRQLTNETGYDGGPFFSPDGTKIGFRASRPKPGAELEKYKQLLSYDLVEPLAMELYTINVDGTGLRKITDLGGSNWAPFYLNDNRHIVFSTNFNATGHFGAFDLYLVSENGSDLERVTFNNGGFDAFPMISRNGKQFVWGSSRNGKSQMDLNLFLADWSN